MPVDPKPWLLCILLLNEAISGYDFPKSGLYSPKSSDTYFEVSCLSLPKKYGCVLKSNFFGLQAPNSLANSGYLLMSPEASNASLAKIADAV